MLCFYDYKGAGRMHTRMLVRKPHLASHKTRTTRFSEAVVQPLRKCSFRTTLILMSGTYHRNTAVCGNTKRERSERKERDDAFECPPIALELYVEKVITR